MRRKLTFILFISFFFYGWARAQETMPKTNTIDVNAKVNKEKERPKRKHYMTIVKFNTKGILYGNKCFEDFTKSMGFFYDVQNRGQSGSLNGFTKFFHNAGVKTALVFTQWPWWKARVNKKKKDCRKLSGDFMG